MNNAYHITVKAPLLRPGLTVETEVSEKYVVPVLNKVMEMVREFNSKNEPKSGAVTEPLFFTASPQEVKHA